MITLKNITLSFAIVAVLNLSPAFSQKKAEMITTKWAEKPVIADGLLDDWQDSLSLYNETTKLHYSLSNDDKNIYLALKSNSRQELTRILIGGISFSAVLEDKKKDNPTVTFPVLDRTPGKPKNAQEQPEEGERQKMILSRIKDIKVKGFKEIIDGGISLQNTYGIRAGAAFDDKNNLVQEIVIPLSLLNLDPLSAELVTYQIKINGLQVPQNGGGMSGRPGYQQQSRGGMYGGYGNQMGGRPMVNKMFTSTEFYIKSKLATKQ